jgi:hypothetical protein
MPTYAGSQAQAGLGTTLSIGGSSLTAPGTVTPTGSTTGGTLAAAAYFYKVTAVGGGGETAGSPEATVTTTGSTSSVALAWAAITGATGYKVYRGTAAGAESVYFTTVANSFNDVGGAGTAGTVPTSGAGTLFGEVIDPDFQRGEWQFDDVTNLESTLDKEVIATIRDTGAVTFTGNRVGADAGQLAVEAAYDTGAKENFTVTLPKKPTQTTAGDSWTFAAYVQKSQFKVEPTKAIKFSVTLKTTGTWAYTAGT